MQIRIKACQANDYPACPWKTQLLKNCCLCCTKTFPVHCFECEWEPAHDASFGAYHTCVAEQSTDRA